MSEKELIENYFKTANSVVIYLMYLKSYPHEKNIKDNLKKYNPGHLGTSLSVNFILANLYYFLNKHNIKSQQIIGTGHSAAGLISNLWLNDTLHKYYNEYSQDIRGLNNLITDFGTKIRSEINPQYPETIYDGGELGYSLGVAYGYALDNDTALVPCIIGDGEAETGTLSSAWQLNKILKTKSKVLPIINLNKMKMGSNSYLSLLTDEELIRLFSSFGYNVNIINCTNEKNIKLGIEKFQRSLEQTLIQESPLIIFKSHKGFTLPSISGIDFQDLIDVHKNPLQKYDDLEKANIITTFLNNWNCELFDKTGTLLPFFDKFKPIYNECLTKSNENIDYIYDEHIGNIKNLEKYLTIKLSKNNNMIFSPDELRSNMLGSLNNSTVEILNENLLQALYQGYINAGNNGVYIAYEGFMPIINSMIAQYYKFLKQKESSINQIPRRSLNYILTSTSLENCFSHQNPEFVNGLLMKYDNYYNVLYPKDSKELIKILEFAFNSNDMINVITTSKRHTTQYCKYESSNNYIDVLINNDEPEMILCATGDYMLDYTFKIYEKLKDKYKIKFLYITNPKILDVNSTNALSDDKFKYYFSTGKPIIYFFMGYPNIIKALLYDRNVDCNVIGYKDGISITGRLEETLEKNDFNYENIINYCEKKLVKQLGGAR